LVDIKGQGPQHIFALSSCGDVLYFNGKRWVSLPSATHQVMKALWVGDTGQAVVGGEGGAILTLDLLPP
jgi:hypothetical protein